MCKRVTIGFGTPARATMQYHEVASNPGRPDRKLSARRAVPASASGGRGGRDRRGFPRLQVLGVLVVVSLLRPKIIRDLDLSRHGLHVLPLESTLTSLPNGNYLGQWGDHDPRAIEAPDDELGSSMAHGFLRPTAPMRSTSPSG